MPCLHTREVSDTFLNRCVQVLRGSRRSLMVEGFGDVNVSEEGVCSVQAPTEI